ncbi:PREDICTED: DNA polymerase beta isoform X2 [Nelumbo nucifera]|uniref:DNA polymerase n=1 Tax=Nelumbo nucifera TaxID=4432 RepID=A0A1U8QAI3_NELNU|nr:PREDICTED: DNA polymerase beta isoform X2 [Nelumbo nucifera]
MAPKTKKKELPHSSDQPGMFDGMVVFLVEKGVQARRLQIWKQKLVQMGATIEDRLSKKVTHIFAMNSKDLLQQVDSEHLKRFKGNVLLYQWLEDSLRSGEKVAEDSYNLNLDSEEGNDPEKSLEGICSKPTKENNYSDEKLPHCKRIRFLSDDLKVVNEQDSSTSPVSSNPHAPVASNKDVNTSELALCYNPPDLNRNITEIFGKLIDIYRALGDERRSFSYYKAIPVIEKLPFKIESVEQVKHLPAIGKSLQDHIHEIITTGKLSKLEHFETDEKAQRLTITVIISDMVRTITLFGDVWGIGPATALKLYEKGYRTLDDLKNEESLTNAQKLGLKYFDDIKKRIPRNEKAGEDVLPGVVIICGGSFRRGKATCGDLDIIITHPDGKSHKGFLPKYVKHLKDMRFLREDLVFSTHSEEGTNSGVDTYFGLCTYPGREQRHRIDLKVYPRDISAFGLIAWTGNDVLNRRLRLLAESKGYRLDDTGLFLRSTKGSPRLTLKTEMEVFDFLGFPWLEPHERNL